MCAVSSNVDVVREAIDSFLHGDFDRSLSFGDPDMVSVRHAPLPDPQTYHGPAGILQMYHDWISNFEGFEMEPVRFSEVGDRVVVEIVQRGRGKASGVEVVGRFWFAYVVVDGKIARQDVYMTEEQALG
jgi:ketosteroid isomerase-like protein